MPAAPQTSAANRLGFLACGCAGALWGTGFFFGKIALREMIFAHMVFYRFFFTSLGLLPLLLTGRPRLDRREWGLLLLGALLGGPVQYLLQFKGLSLTTVAHAALMVGTMPVILAVGAALFAHERMDSTGWGSLAVSTAGASLIALGGTHHHTEGGPSLTGDLLVVLSLCIALFWILLNKRLMQRHSAIVISAYSLLSAFLMLALWVPLQYGPPPVHGVSMKAWLALAASGLLCTVTATTLWNWGLTQVPASQAGIFLNMEPMMGSALGVLVLGEHLGPTAWTGGIMILLAAFVLTTRSRTTTNTQPTGLVTE